jgi:predicted anti-sigma-YlaC factor YlaD
MAKTQPSREDYRRMPFNEKVIEHIRSCPACLALFNELADETDRKAYAFWHRN